MKQSMTYSWRNDSKLANRYKEKCSGNKEGTEEKTYDKKKNNLGAKII